MEQELVEHIHHLAKIGYRYTQLQIIELASQYAHSCQKLPKNKSLSQQWFNGFIKRWPDLKNIKPSSLDALRAKETNKKKIKEYFKGQSWGFTSRSTARVILGQVLRIATCGTRTHRGDSL